MLKTYFLKNCEVFNTINDVDDDDDDDDDDDGDEYHGRRKHVGEWIGGVAQIAEHKEQWWW